MKASFDKSPVVIRGPDGELHAAQLQLSDFTAAPFASGALTLLGLEPTRTPDTREVPAP